MAAMPTRDENGEVTCRQPWILKKKHPKSSLHLERGNINFEFASFWGSSCNFQSGNYNTLMMNNDDIQYWQHRQISPQNWKHWKKTRPYHPSQNDTPQWVRSALLPSLVGVKTSWSIAVDSSKIQNEKKKNIFSEMMGKPEKKRFLFGLQILSSSALCRSKVPS